MHTFLLVVANLIAVDTETNVMLYSELNSLSRANACNREYKAVYRRAIQSRLSEIESKKRRHA
jgi:asparagine synthetase A